MRHNHDLALRARDLLVGALRIDPPAPDEMIGSMAAVPLPDESGPQPPTSILPVQQSLWADHHIEVPVNVWPSWPQLLLRVSAQIYNDVDQYERLAQLLRIEARPSKTRG
jgi:isopenicillin-N epimerase